MPTYTDEQRAFELGRITYQQCRGVVATAPYSVIFPELNRAWWKGYHEAKNRNPQQIDDGTQGYGQKPMGAGK